uniref:Uncharacterized protein n=1 Tax=Brassica oleracea var. oleracea TaxID=109376 RepID=A0A0D3E467_BRAOL
MARPRRIHVRTEAEITRDAIAELQAQMQTITAALHNLNVQQPPPPARDNVERASNDDDEDDEEVNLFAAAAAEHANPFAPLRNDRVLVQDNVRGAAAVVPWETGFKTEIPEFHGNSSAEELLDWIVTVEEILEFKRAPM